MKNGRSSPIFRQKGGMHYDHAMFELLDEFGRYHVSIRADNSKVRTLNLFSKLVPLFFSGFLIITT